MSDGQYNDTPPDSDTSVAAPVPDMTPAQWLAMAREAHTGSQTYFDSSIRRDIIEDMRQVQGMHPSGSKYYSDLFKTRSRLFRPKTRSAIRKNEAVAAEAFFSTTDVISITPENDGDEHARAGAEVMQYLLQYRLTKTIPWFMTVIGAYQEAQSVGVVCSEQDWEYDVRRKIDRPRIRLVPIENIRVDPASDWTDPINSSPYVIREIPMYVKDVKARCKPGTNGEPAKWIAVTDGQIRASTKKTLDAIRQTREVRRQDSKAQESAITDFSIAWVHRNIIEVDGQDWIFYTLGTDALLSMPVPLENEYFTGKRPYVMGVVVLEAHKIYPGSVPRMTRDISAEINEIANQRIDNVKFAMNKRWLARRNKQVDIRSLMRNVPNSVTLMESVDDVKVVDTPDVTSSSYQEQDRLNLDFDDLAGSFSQSSVQSNRNLNETVGGMNILTDSANQVGGYQLRTFVETWVEPVLRQLILLESHYETDETVLALAGKKAGMFERFGVDAITDDLLLHDMLVRVNVGMGATSPKDKLNNVVTGFNSIKAVLADGVLEQHGLKATEVITEILAVVGYRDAERFFAIDGEDATVLALRDQLQKLQQALDAKMPPELLAAQVGLVKAQTKGADALTVQNLGKAIFAAMQSAQVIAQIPQVSPIADMVMKSAGYQTPTPEGVDPNFPEPPAVPQPSAPIPTAMAGNPVTAATGGAQNTDPESPALPASPDVGANAGIETTRSDSTA